MVNDWIKNAQKRMRIKQSIILDELLEFEYTKRDKHPVAGQ